jgi:hypothetical protein
MYCGGSPEMVRATKGQLQTNYRFILRLAAHLRERVVPQVKTAERILDEAGFTVHSGIEEIEGYAELLVKLADLSLKRAASDKVSGRDQHLRFLAEMVARITGREHYAELAKLTGAVKFAYTGEIWDVTAETIGRKIRKLRRLDSIDDCSARELEEFSNLAAPPNFARIARSHAKLGD